MRFPAFPRGFAACCAAVGLAALVSACASTPAQQAGLRPRLAQAGEPAAEIQLPGRQHAADATTYGLFLAGEAALDRNSSADAARLLGQASEISGDSYVKERAFTAAVVAGEIDRAAAVPLDGQASIATERLARLVRAVQMMAANRGPQALALLKSQPAEGQTAQAVILLTPWAAAMANDWTAALASAPGAASGTPQFTGLFAAFGRAELLERAGRPADAETALKALTVNPDNIAFALGYGAFLERHGRRKEAIALYDRVLAKNPDTDVAFALERAKAGRPAPPMPSLQEGAGEALFMPASVMMARRQPEVGLALMRLSLWLDPKLDDAWLSVGDAMAAAGDVDAARQAYNQIAPASLQYADAQGRLAWSFQRAGDSEQALKLAKGSLDRTRNSPDALSLYADLLRENGRFEDSIAVIDKLIASDSPGLEPGRLYYLRGVSWDQAGRWDKAEPDLQQALKLDPADPDVMNYLGFAWTTRNQHLNEALEMLQKAANLRPQSGEIRDSLGWAKYRLGRYQDAVRDLERAVQLSPAEPDINDHLGDAYWKVGRRLEAQFQWTQVLSLGPEEKLRATVGAKLQGGLDAAAPLPGPVAEAAPQTAQP